MQRNLVTSLLIVLVVWLGSILGDVSQAAAACLSGAFSLPLDVKVYPLQHLDAIARAKQRRGVRYQRGTEVRNWPDTEMGGHNPRIEVRAAVSKINQTQVSLRVSVHMEEDRADWTYFTGETTQTITVPILRQPGCVVNLTGTTTGRIDARGGHNKHGLQPFQGKGIIRSATCVSDTRGDDRGKLGCTSFRFTNITFTSKAGLPPAPSLVYLRDPNWRRGPELTLRWRSRPDVAFHKLCVSWPGIACTTPNATPKPVVMNVRRATAKRLHSSHVRHFVSGRSQPAEVHWTVAACDSLGRCAWQQRVGKIIVPPEPVAPTLLSPASGATAPVPNPTRLHWRMQRPAAIDNMVVCFGDQQANCQRRCADPQRCNKIVSGALRHNTTGCWLSGSPPGTFFWTAGAQSHVWGTAWQAQRRTLTFPNSSARQGQVSARVVRRSSNRSGGSVGRSGPSGIRCQ